MSQMERKIDQLVGLASEVSPAQVGVSTEFLITLALLGDIIMAATGLSLGYWIRFKSRWIPFRSTDKGLHDLASYSPLIFIGVVFLIGTFVYQRLYCGWCKSWFDATDGWQPGLLCGFGWQLIRWCRRAATARLQF